MRRASDAAILFVALGLTAACGDGSGAKDAGVDADARASDAAGDARARDSGPRDARAPEAGLDARVPDSGPRDAGPDAGPTGWTLVDGLPDGCVVEQADDPTGVRPIVFEPCPDRPGCRQLRRAGLVESGEQLAVYRPRGIHTGSVGRIPVLLHRMDRRALFLAVDDTATIALALRINRGSDCFLVDAASANQRFGIIVGNSATGDCAVLNCPLSDLPDAACAVAGSWTVDELNGNSAQDIFGAESHLAVHSSPAQTVWRLDWSGGTPIAIGGWQRDRVLGEPTAVAEDATFFTQYGATEPHTIRVSVGAEPSEPTSTRLVANSDSDALGLRTDGHDMVWHQGFGRPSGSYNEFERVELWTSTFATAAEAVVPRRLLTLENRFMDVQYELGFGRWAGVQGSDAREIWIVDLRDASRLLLTAPTAEIWIGGIVYVGPDEIAVAPGARGSFADQRTVMLVRYDSLGPPISP